MDFSNLGIALGAYTDEAKAQADEGRKQRIFAQQEKDWQRQDEIDKNLKETHDWYNQGMQAIKEGRIGDFAPSAVDYLNSTNYMGKSRGAYMQGGDGKHYVAYSDGNKSGPPQMLEVTPQMAQSALRDMYMHRLAAADPRAAFSNMNAMEQLGLKREEVGVKRQEVDDKGAYQRGILEWHDKQASRPSFMQDGTGRILGITPEGKLLGTYGLARPDHSGAQLALTNQLLAANRELNAKYAPQFEAMDKELADAYATGDHMKVRAAQAKAQLLNGAYQREMSVKNPSAGVLRLTFPAEPDGRAAKPTMAFDKYAELYGNNRPAEVVLREYNRTFGPNSGTNGQGGMNALGEANSKAGNGGSTAGATPKLGGVTAEDLSSAGWSAKRSGLGGYKVHAPNGAVLDGAELQNLYGIDPKLLPTVN